MDVHVPKAITDGVKRCGIDVATAQQMDAGMKNDDELLALSVTQGRLLFTQDADSLEIAYRWQNQDFLFPGIIFCRQLNCSIGRTVEELELLCKCAAPLELESRITFLPLGTATSQ